MTTSRSALLVFVVAVLVSSSSFALAGPVGPVVRKQSPQSSDARSLQSEAEGGQERAEDEAAIDPASLPDIDVVTTDEQEAALRLVETILAEQQLLLSGQNFVYQAGGRRDPFRSLLAARQREISAPELRPPGVPGFLINEVLLGATASYQGRWQAMIIGIDQRTYFVEVGAVLYDGRIVEISGDEVIFEQDVEDMLGARSTRRVSKRLANGNQEY